MEKANFEMFIRTSMSQSERRAEFLRDRVSGSLQFLCAGNNKDRIARCNFSRMPVIGRARPIAGRKSLKLCEEAIIQQEVKDETHALEVVSFQP